MMWKTLFYYLCNAVINLFVRISQIFNVLSAPDDAMHVPLELKSTNVADLNRQFEISVNLNPKNKDSGKKQQCSILTLRSLWKCWCTDVRMYPRGEPSCHHHRKQQDDHLVKTWQGQTKWQWEKSHFMRQTRKVTRIVSYLAQRTQLVCRLRE